MDAALVDGGASTVSQSGDVSPASRKSVAGGKAGRKALAGTKAGRGRGGAGDAAKKRTVAEAEPMDPEQEAEMAELVDLQVYTIGRFRKHLSTFFGSPERAFQAMDENEDGELTIEEMLNCFEQHGIPECDDEGAFDLRLLFYIFDGDQSGELSFDELFYSSSDELRASIVEAIKRQDDEQEDIPSADTSAKPARNMVERFRRILTDRFRTLARAFTALDFDSSGDLSLEEMVAGLRRARVQLVDAKGEVDVSAAFNAMDSDHDGVLTTHELEGKLSRRSKGKSSQLDPALVQEIDLAVDYVKNFRAHLFARFGDKAGVLEAFGKKVRRLPFSGFLEGLHRLEVPEQDMAGRCFDFRRVFCTLASAGVVSLKDFLSASDKELKDAIIFKVFSGGFERISGSCDAVTYNSAERFRRLCVEVFGSVEAAFKKVDMNGNGDLSLTELKEGFRSYFPSPTDGLGGLDIRVVFKALDADLDGEVKLSDFCSVWPVCEAWAGKIKLGVPDSMPRGMKTVVERRAVKARAVAEVEASVAEPDRSNEGEVEPEQTAIQTVVQQVVETVEEAADFLDFRHCCLGRSGAVNLSASFSANTDFLTRIRSINLHGNYIGDVGIASLVGALEQSSALCRLVLSLNGIGDCGAARLSRTIRKVPSFTELVLSDNHVGNYGAKKLAQALSKQPAPSLRVLDLRRNAIEIFGMRELGQGLRLQLLLQENPGLVEKTPVALGAVWGEHFGGKLRSAQSRKRRAQSAPGKAMLDEAKAAGIRLPPTLSKSRVGDVEQPDGPPSTRPGSKASRRRARKPITTAMASTLSAEGGEVWGPLKSLRFRMDFARTVGEGAFASSCRREALLLPRCGTAEGGARTSRPGQPRQIGAPLGTAVDM